MGKCNILKHNIQLTDQQPFKERYRRIPPHLFEEVKQHLQEMVEVGTIRRSFSLWVSAVVLVRKKDGGLRLCIDLRKLNNRTIKDGYALPRIDDTLDCLHGAKWFSTLDLTVRLLAGGVRGGSQASACIYHGPFRLLGM